MLKAMGIEDEKIEQIIEAHTETTDTLKQERDELKKSASTLEEVRERLKATEKELEEAKSDDGFKAKYDQEHKAFEEFKAEVRGKEAKAEKGKLYRELLTAAGIDPKRVETIMKVTALDGFEVEDGKLKDAEKLTEGIKTEWAEFIPATDKKGASVPTPPANNNGAAEPKTIAEALRQRYTNN